MGEVVVMKTTARQDSGVVQIGGMAVCKWSQVTPLLGLYLDMADNWRLAIGGQGQGAFRGYAERQGDQWVVSVWCGSGKPKAFYQRNVTFKTEDGAVRALSRMAAQVEG